MTHQITLNPGYPSEQTLDPQQLQDPAQGVLDVHHGLLEAVAFLVESMAMYSAEAIARGKA